MMELFLSSDGKHTVHVTGEGADDLFKSLPQAKMLYEAVVKAYGTKATARRGSAETRNEAGQTSAHPEAPFGAQDAYGLPRGQVRRVLVVPNEDA